MRGLIKNIFNIFGAGYYRFRAWDPVRRFLNRRARALFRTSRHELSVVEERICADLRIMGIASVHISELLGQEMFSELSAYAVHRWASPEIQREASLHREILAGVRPKAEVKKPFLVNLWEGEMDADVAKPLLDLNHPFTRFSLSTPVLAIVNAYLEMFSKFRAWRLEATISMPQGIRASSSQRWHRDGEDVQLVKVFLYLNDVFPASGPFMYLKYSHIGGRWRQIFAPHPPSGSPKMPPGEDQFIPKDDIAVMSGKAGTIIFCDTSGLHKGGFTETDKRLMYTSVYTSSSSPQPIRYRYQEQSSTEGLTREAAFAIENNPHQREPKYHL